MVNNHQEPDTDKIHNSLHLPPGKNEQEVCIKIHMFQTKVMGKALWAKGLGHALQCWRKFPFLSVIIRYCTFQVELLSAKIHVQVFAI